MKKHLLALVFAISTVSAFAQIPAYVPTNGLQGWWPFNNNANDESGNANNGTPLNGASLTTDRFGIANTAYSFDGANDVIYVNKSFFDNGWNEYTISSWVYLYTIANTNNVNSSHIFINTSPHNGMCMVMNWGASPKYSLWLGSGTPSTSWNGLFNGKGNQNIVAGSWKFVTLTKNGNTFSMFIDGVLDKTWTSAVSIQPYNYKMYFGGGDPLTTIEVMNGKIDDIGIWNRELTSAEITALFQASGAGVNEYANNNLFSIFPSPATGQITVKADPTIIGSVYSICDQAGKIVLTGKLTSENTTVELGDLSAGMYFFSVGENLKQTFKVIKQ